MPEACAKAGNVGKTIEIALDVEQLTYEVNTLLNAGAYESDLPS